MPMSATLTGAPSVVVRCEGAPRRISAGDTVIMTPAEWAALPAATQALFIPAVTSRGSLTFDSLDADFADGSLNATNGTGLAKSGITLSVIYGTSAGTAAAGNDPRLGSGGIAVVDLARDGTDQTAKLQAAINAAMADGHGWLVITHNAGNQPTVILSSAQITFPNDGATPPTQRSLTIQGQGASHNGQGGSPRGGTILDCQWVGGAGVGKFFSAGLGHLTFKGITFMDSVDGTTDFIHTTATTLDCTNDVEFFGKTPANAGTSTFPLQDAIVLGGTGSTSDTTPNAPYQGYGSRVEGCHFNRVRRGVYGRTYCNGATVRNNTFWVGCGSDATAGAIEFLGGGGNSDTGLLVDGNIIETSNYVYPVKLTGVTLSNFGPNGFFDPTSTTLCCYWFDATSLFNTVIDGYRLDTKPLVVENGASIGTNTQITGHQSQPSVFAQNATFSGPVSKFTKTVQFTGGASGSPVVQPSAAQAAGTTIFQALRSAAEGTNPGTNIFNLTYQGQVFIGGALPQIVLQDATGATTATLSPTGIARAGAGGAMLFDSGTGGSHVDVKCFDLRIKKYTDGTFSHVFGASILGFFGGTGIAQIARKGQLTDNSGGTSGGATIAAIGTGAAAANQTDTANAIATLAAKGNALETVLSAAGGGYGLTA